MAAEVALPRRGERTRGSALDRLAAIPAAYVVGAIVAASFIVRALLARAHVTPYYLPDEYVYSTLAHGIASGDGPSVRGTSVTFPALLEPILTAAFWLPGDPLLAFQLTKALHALAFSLAAIPVYLLARRLRLRPRMALAAASLAVAAPGGLYASFALAEPIAYPLVLTAVYLGVRALDAPTTRAQLAFVACTALTTFARLQYAVVAVAFLAAALVVEHGRIGRAARSFAVTIAAVAIPACAALALGPARLLGGYATIADRDIDAASLGAWVARTSMLLAYSCGWVLVPGAIIAVACSFTRRVSRTECAFGALSASVVVALVLEASAISAVDSSRFHERYLIAVPPLAVLAFGVYLRRGAPHRRAVSLLALGLLLISARAPLSRYVLAHGVDDSPLLFALRRLAHVTGMANAALVFAAVAAVLSLVAVVAAFRPRIAGAAALGLSLVVSAGIAAGAYSYDARNARSVRDADLPRDLRWVDHARLGGVALLHPIHGGENAALQQLFWNRSIDKVLILDPASPVDNYGAEVVTVYDDGVLRIAGRPLQRPLLVNTYLARAAFVGATSVARTRGFELWRPDAAMRISVLSLGQYANGWLADRGAIFIWPDERGHTRGELRLSLSLPREAKPTALRFTADGVDRRIVVRPGEQRHISFPVAAKAPWRLRFRTNEPGYLDQWRAVSVQAKTPVFVRAPAKSTVT